MSEEQYVSLTGCGHGPTKLVEGDRSKVFESVVARSEDRLDIVYGYVDDTGEIDHMVKEVGLNFDNFEESERLFWDNE